MLGRLIWTGPALALLVPAAACTPPASAVPLGLGPLAVDEQRAELQAAATRRRQKPARPERARLAESTRAPEPKVKAEPDDTDDGDGDDADFTDDAKPGAGPALEGMFAGADIAVFRLTGLPEREQRDDKAKIRIDTASGGNVSITLINSEDGSDLCELMARVEGHAALIESAQPCFSDGSEGSLEAQLTSGRAVVDGDRLKMDAEGTLSVALPDQELDGKLTYSFKGERQ